VVLQNVDITLPRRHVKDSVAQQQLEERQAKEITKASILASQKQAELEARMLEYVVPTNDNTSVSNVMNANEYDDDYDDQYDYDVHYFVDASKEMDTTFDDQPPDRLMDYDAIRTYNRTMKDIESDQEYWNQNRNMNRNTNTNNATPTMTMESSDRTDSKQYRGPDLLRGGRIPHPHNHPQTSSGTGRGRGRGGNGGRGRGAANSGSQPPQSQPTAQKTTTGGSTTTTTTDAAVNTKAATPNLRHKARVLDKRRDQQKKAQMKRTGGV
jgi:hypothetical protein